MIFSIRPEEHVDSEAHGKLKKNYIKWMRRKLKFRPELMSEVDSTLSTIARKLDLKVSEVSFIGVHSRRGNAAHLKKYHKKKPLKKGYFYDAMEEMRESYTNPAFLYVSDDMKWARASIKDKQNDLYFVGRHDIEVTTELLNYP